MNQPDRITSFLRPPQHDDLHVFFLRGNVVERAGQLGEALTPLLDDERHDFDFWIQFVHHTLRHQIPVLSPRARRGVEFLIDRLLVDRIARNLPRSYRDALEAFVAPLANKAGRPNATSELADQLRRLHVTYDAIEVLAGLPPRPKIPAGPFGCSSLVVGQHRTVDGHLIHGRNFDLLPHAETLRPIVCVHHPDKGLKHVSIHHSGGFTPGITSTNEAGITLGVHQNFTRAVSANGQSVIVMAMNVIEQSSSVGDAVAILRAGKSAGGWTFVVSDAQHNQSCAVEIDANGVSVVQPTDGVLDVANCYRTDRRSSEFGFSGVWTEHNQHRLSQLRSQAARVGSDFTVPEMQKCIADHADDRSPGGPRRAYGNCVSAIHNLDCMITAPTADRLYVGVGRSPRNSSVGYVGFKLSALFAGRDERVESLPGLFDSTFTESLYHHSDGLKTYYESENLESARQSFVHAETLDTQEPLHTFWRGITTLKLGDPRAARDCFANVAERETSPHRAFVARLMAARAADLCGDRTASRTMFSDVVNDGANHVDPTVVARAKRGLKRAFRPRDVDGLVVDAIMADVAT